jgi:hypothetical protein
MSGALKSEQQVAVWNTPGTNDQEGLDELVEQMMHRVCFLALLTSLAASS